MSVSIHNEISGSARALLQRFHLLRQACLALTAGLAGTILLAWLVEPVAAHLPAGWNLMKANTAVLLLLCVVAAVTSSGRGTIRRSIGRVCSLVVMAGGLVTLLEYMLHRNFGVDTLLAADALSYPAGRMSPHSAVAFMLLGVSFPLLRARRKPMRRIADATALLLCALIIMIAAGTAFRAMGMMGVSLTTRTAPTTLVCMLVLAVAIVTWRAEHGVFSILLGSGIGSRLVRWICPLTLVLPFGLELLRIMVVRWHMVDYANATAMIAAMLTGLVAAFTLAVAWRMNEMERRLRELSLLDDLTRLRNHRGFYTLAADLFRDARAADEPFSVLYVDLDGLKRVNDEQGHDAGSTHLALFANMLQGAFPEDCAVGRLGGDEFSVAAAVSAEILLQATEMLENTANTHNAASPAPPISFSYGVASCEAGRSCSLQDLVSEADQRMYTVKREKRARMAAALPDGTGEGDFPATAAAAGVGRLP